jgi:hypothetical protein
VTVDHRDPRRHLPAAVADRLGVPTPPPSVLPTVVWVVAAAVVFGFLAAIRRA